MLEKELEQKCCEYAKRNGWLTYKFVSPNNKGVPDRIFIYVGIVWFVEFKTEKGLLSKHQTTTINAFASYKLNVDIITNFTQFVSKMKLIKELNSVN